MSQALYRKWRPRLWDQVVGQEHIIHTLQNAVRAGRVAHAYLFAGPRGTGKTTTARLLAKAVNCLAEDLADRPCDHCEHCQAVNEGRFLDLIEIDAASNTSVDDVRDLRDKINFSPSQGRYKVYIIDEVHMLSGAAFNALLKTLEEPPAHAIFILATTEVHKIPATVLSRCQRHEFRRIPLAQIVELLKHLCEEEKLQVDDEALTLIARQSTGCMRDAISLLDQLASTGEQVTLESAQTVLGTATSQAVIDLAGAILDSNPAAGLECIHHALDGGSDARQFARQVVEYLRGLLLLRMGSGEGVDVPAEQRARMAEHARRFEVPHLLECIRLFNSAASDVRSGWQPSLLLELAFAEAVGGPAQAPAAVPVTPSAPAVRPAVQPSVQAPAAAPHEELTAPSPANAVEKSVPAAPPPVSPSPAQTPGIDLQSITQNWARIRAQVKRQRSQTEGLLNSCKPLAVRDGALVLGFASDLLKTKMEQGENIQLIREVIRQVVGIDLAVVCAVMGARATQNPNDLGVDSDGMVGTALNLGGQIVQKE